MNAIRKTSLSVLVPAYNEEYLVESSLNRLLVLEESAMLERIQVIVVDDCSTDNTPQVLSRLSTELPAKSKMIEWKFLRHPENAGKGKALQTALQESECEITIIHDADLEYYPEDILRMIPLFIEENADAVYGSRFVTHEYRRILMFRHELGNRFLTFCCNLISNLNLTDMETCYKALRTELFKSITLHSRDFRIEPEITIKLGKRNARIFEIPINYCGRTYSEGKKINWKDGIKAIWAIIKFGFSDDIFAGDQFGSKILMRLSRANRFNSWTADIIRPYIGESVLEIGAGIGNLTKKLIPKERYYLTDINSLYLGMAKNLQFDKPYLSVEYLDINDVSEFRNDRKQFDTIICLNVIEHIDDDVKAMQNIADLLEDDGNAIILVPRGRNLFGSLDEILGHKRRYSESEIRALAEKSGFQITHVIPFNRVSTIPWYINGKIFKKRTFGLFQIYMMDLLTPVFRKIDNMLPVPSLSYIFIMKKKRKILL